MYRVVFSISDWSVSRVCSYLYSVGIDEEDILILRNEEISGECLLQLNDEKLINIGIQTFGRRNKILQKIQNLIQNQQKSNNETDTQAFEKSSEKLFNPLCLICFSSFSCLCCLVVPFSSSHFSSFPSHFDSSTFTARSISSYPFPTTFSYTSPYNQNYNNYSNFTHNYFDSSFIDDSIHEKRPISQENYWKLNYERTKNKTKKHKEEKWADQSRGK